MEATPEKSSCNTGRRIKTLRNSLCKKNTGDRLFAIRYFTTVAEVELCGHATIASFVAMWDIRRWGHGIRGQVLWLEGGRGVVSRFWIVPAVWYTAMKPAVISMGLHYILLSVEYCATLKLAIMDMEKVMMLLRKHPVVGEHIRGGGVVSLVYEKFN